MFRLQLGAFALAAALAAPLVASAQTAPVVPGPAAAAPGAAAPMQRHHRHHRHHHGGFARAMRGLNLSADQKTKLAAIFKSARDSRKPAFATGVKPDPQTRKANMLAMRQQIDGILTDTQRAQLAANLKAGRHMHKDGQGPRPLAPAPAQ